MYMFGASQNCHCCITCITVGVNGAMVCHKVNTRQVECGDMSRLSIAINANVQHIESSGFVVQM